MSKVSVLTNAETAAVFTRTLNGDGQEIKKAMINNRSTNNSVHKLTMQPCHYPSQVAEPWSRSHTRGLMQSLPARKPVYHVAGVRVKVSTTLKCSLFGEVKAKERLC